MNELLEIRGRLSWEAWASRMRDVKRFHQKFPFYVGDLILYGEQYFHEKSSQMINETGLAHETLMNYKMVAKRIPAEERADVPFTVYQDIASLPRRERDKIVTGFQAGTMKRADIRALKASANGNGASEPEKPPDVLTALENAVASAYVTVGKLIERRERGKLTLAALEELTAATVAYAEKLER